MRLKKFNKKYIFNFLIVNLIQLIKILKFNFSSNFCHKIQLKILHKKN